MVFADILKFHGRYRANVHVNISLRDRYIWFKNPKVGSTTLGRVLLDAQKRMLPFLEARAHSGIESSLFTKPYQLPPGMLNNLLTGESMVRFAFVRNPFTRLVSAYKDKIQNNRPPKAIILNLLGLDKDDLEQYVSFEDFVAVICDGEIERHDPHWSPQVYTTCAHWVSLDFVGKLEQFDDDFQALREFLPTNAIGEEYEPGTPHKTDANESWKDYFQSPELVKKVTSYYEQDFDTFKYSTHIS